MPRTEGVGLKRNGTPLTECTDALQRRKEGDVGNRAARSIAGIRSRIRRIGRRPLFWGLLGLVIPLVVGSLCFQRINCLVEYRFSPEAIIDALETLGLVVVVGGLLALGLARFLPGLMDPAGQPGGVVVPHPLRCVGAFLASGTATIVMLVIAALLWSPPPEEACLPTPTALTTTPSNGPTPTGPSEPTGTPTPTLGPTDNGHTPGPTVTVTPTATPPPSCEGIGAHLACYSRSSDAHTGCPTNVVDPGNGLFACEDVLVVSPPVMSAGLCISMTERRPDYDYGFSLWEVRVYGDAGGDRDLAPDATVFPSSCQDDDCVTWNPRHAVDPTPPPRRWSSTAATPQWYQIILPEAVPVHRIALMWETSYAEEYCVYLLPADKE
jgi:hypothetical protein